MLSAQSAKYVSIHLASPFTRAAYVLPHSFYFFLPPSARPLCFPRSSPAHSPFRSFLFQFLSSARTVLLIRRVPTGQIEIFREVSRGGKNIFRARRSSSPSSPAPKKGAARRLIAGSELDECNRKIDGGGKKKWNARGGRKEEGERRRKEDRASSLSVRYLF